MNVVEQINRAQKHLALKQYKQAHENIIQLLQFDKYQADGYFLLAMIASEHNNFKKAIALIEQAMVLAPNNAEYIAHLAKHFALTNEQVKAKYMCEKALMCENLTAIVLDTIGVVYSKIGLHQCAIKHFNQAVALAPNNANFHFNLAVSLKFTGDFDGARAAFEKTIDLAPRHYKAYSSLASLNRVNEKYQQNILYFNITPNAHEHSVQPDDGLYMGHAQARLYEKQGHYRQAYQALLQAKKRKLSELNYSITDDLKIFQRLRSAFTQQGESKLAKACLPTSEQSNEAIFVVGMPRSGTTLVERILTNHADVTSAGELQNFGLLLKEFSTTQSPYVIDTETIDAANHIDFKALAQRYIESTRVITGATPRFVDKMPLNFLYVGFIVSAFPNAKIVCLDRNPLDTIVSNFRQLFSVNFSYYNYAYDLESAAQYYLQFKALTKFWQEKYPDNFYLVNYENLVNSPSVEAKKLVNFCQLTWQDSLVDIDKNDSPVATASAVQVRSPINNKAIGNWRHYDFCLENVKKILLEAGVSI